MHILILWRTLSAPGLCRVFPFILVEQLIIFKLEKRLGTPSGEYHSTVILAQLLDEKAAKAACSSSRSAVASYPVQVGRLWVLGLRA